MSTVEEPLVEPDTARDAYESLSGMVVEFAQWLSARVATVEDLHDLSAIAPGGVVPHLLGEFERELRAGQAKGRQARKEARGDE